MLVTTIDHGKKVFERLIGRQSKNDVKYLVYDTETEPKPPYGKQKKNKDALIYGRQHIVIWSVCYRGESYSFPTSNFDPKFPTPVEWAEIFRPYAESKEIIKVAHNAKYDGHVFETSTGVPVWTNIWCTSVGCWVSNMAAEKSLKSRAPLYGRHLRKTSTINFSDLDELSVYAEEDVIVTDEVFQMQCFGEIRRPNFIYRLAEDGSQTAEKVRLPTGKHAIPLEGFSKFQRLWFDLHEMPVLHSARRAERRGFPFNVKKITSIREQLEADKVKVLKRIYRTAGKKFNLQSTAQVGEVLDTLGVDNPHVTKKGKKSVSAQALFFLKDAHPIVSDIVTFRKIQKLESVYVSEKGLAYYVDKGRIHTTLNTTGAVTGRFSSQFPNLTQVPSRADTYGIKDCFIAPKGQKIVCLDYAQLEIRVMAIMCKDPAMMKILRRHDGDIHQNTADTFGVDRSPTAKQLNFLMLYGGGAYMLSRKLSSEGVPTSDEKAQEYIDTYNRVYHRVHEFREELIAFHERNGYIRMLTGRKRWLLDVDWTNRSQRHKAETTLSNNCIQGSGQDLLKATIIRTDPACPNPDRAILNKMEIKDAAHKAYVKDRARLLENKIRPALKLAKVRWLLQVHDESLWLVDEKAAEEVGQMLADVMCWKHFFPAVTGYDVPIVAEGGVGDTWKKAKSKEPDFKLEAGWNQ